MANQVIDSHVHCRDEEQSGKATIAEVLGLAREQGVDMIFDMPNTARPVVNRERVKERLALVPKGSEACYRLYVGLTADPAQIEKAVWCFNDFKEVIGLKLYAGPSTGDLAVLKASEQFLIYKTLSQFGYIGVLAVHCEKATHFLLDSFHSFRPITYCDVRPKIAEIESVGDQICFAEEAHFLGILHICHVSCKETVDLVEAARKRGLIRITCGVTPHHIMYDNTAMLGSDGYRHICNPPLREYGDVFALRCCVVWDRIDWIESDHAPHTEEEKRTKFLAGYPGLFEYLFFIEEFLPNYMGISNEQIRKMTSTNILNAFGNKLIL